MTLKDDLVGCVVTDIELGGDDGDVVSITMSDRDGRIYVTELNEPGYMDILRIF